MTRARLRTAAAALLLVAAAVPHQRLSAQENRTPLHGFAQTNWAARTTGARRATGEPGDFLVGEERLQLELGQIGGGGRAGFLAKVDFAHDALADAGTVEVREAYLDLDLGRVGVRAGRQIITWGVGDLLFVSDVFPKDWSAFFAGRPVEYLKLGSDAVRVDLAAGAVSAEFVIMPVFQPDRTPSPDRFVLPDPFAGMVRERRFPRARIENAPVALRVRRRLAGAEVSVSAYSGYAPMTSPRLTRSSEGLPTRVEERHARLDVYAATLRRPAAGGLLSAEFGYLRSPEDERGDDPWVPNSGIRGLVGYQRPLGQDGIFGLQYYVESMMDFERFEKSLPEGVTGRGRHRQLAMARVVRYSSYQLWEFSAVAFYALDEGDYLLTPTVRHRFSDELNISFGANVFGGDATSPFGALDGNDNVFVVARYSF